MDINNFLLCPLLILATGPFTVTFGLFLLLSPRFSTKNTNAPLPYSFLRHPFCRKVGSHILLQHFSLSILVRKSKHFVKHRNPKITLPKNPRLPCFFFLLMHRLGLLFSLTALFVNLFYCRNYGSVLTALNCYAECHAARGEA